MSIIGDMRDFQSAQGPFEHFAVDEPIVNAGVRVQGHAGDIDALMGGVNASHAPAVAGVAGLLSLPMVQAEQPVRDRTLTWAASAVFAGGAVVRFGSDVLAFNNAIDELNQRYWSAKGGNFGVAAPDLPADATTAQTQQADRAYSNAVAAADVNLMAQLQAEIDTVHEPTLDEAATHVAGLLDRGPDDAAAVLELYSAGALPLAAPALFPGVTFASVPPPLGAEQGRRAADVIQRALDGDASPAEFREAMAMLQLISDHALYVQQNGGTLTEDNVAFLHTFYNTLGERVYEVPTYVGDRDINWSDDRQDLMLAAMGTGLLALSNTALWDPSIRRGANPMDPDSRYHLPPSLVDLVENPIAWRVNDLPGEGEDELRAFQALAAMLRETDGDMQGGRDFSLQLTLRVAEFARESGADHVGGDRHDIEPTVLLPLLDVSTRNAEANTAILTGDYAAPRASTGFDGYPIDVEHPGALLYLYSYEWSDDGRTVAGLTDWIRGYSVSTNPDHAELAALAAAGLIETVTSTEGHSYRYGDRYNMYDYMMETLDDRNPEVAASFGRVATAYLPEFGGLSPFETNVTEAIGAGISISDADKSRFFDLVATNHDAINLLSHDAGAYKELQLRTALASGDWAAVQEAGIAGRLDGLLAAARVHADVVVDAQNLQSDRAAWAEHMYYANLGKGAFTTATGLAIATPTANPTLVTWANFGIGQISDRALAALLPAPAAADLPSVPSINSAGGPTSIASYDYLTAMIGTGDVSPQDVEAFAQRVHEGSETVDGVRPGTFLNLTEQSAGQPGPPQTSLRGLGHLSSADLAVVNELVLRASESEEGNPYVDHYDGGTEYERAAHRYEDEVEDYRKGTDSYRPGEDEED